MDEISEYRMKLGRRMPGISNGYKEITGADAFRHPCLLVFGGTETTSDAEANALAKRAEYMLGRHQSADNAVAVYAATYPKSGEQNNAAIRHYNECIARGLTSDYVQKPGKKKYRPSPEISRFARDYLVPLVAEGVEYDAFKDVKGGTRLPMAQLEKNLRNINIVAHSYGTMVVDQLGDALAGYMRQLGFDAHEVREATRQVSVLSVGDVIPLESTKNAHFTTLHVLNEKDALMEIHSPQNNALVRRLLAAKTAGNEVPPLVVSPVPTALDAGNRWLAAARRLIPMERLMRDDSELLPDTAAHDFETHALIGIPQAPAGMNIPAGEEKSLNYSNAFMLPVIAASFLRNALDNSVRNASSDALIPLGKVKSLLACVPSGQLAYPMSAHPAAHPYPQLHLLARGVDYEARLQQAVLSEESLKDAMASAPSGRGRF